MKIKPVKIGNKYIGPPKKLIGPAYQLSRFEKVGLYGIRFVWKDGHMDGIYTFDLLKVLNNDK